MPTKGRVHRFEEPKPARLTNAGGTWWTECEVHTISDRGAKVTVGDTEVPAEDLLLVFYAQGGGVNRKCQIALIDGPTVHLVFLK